MIDLRKIAIWPEGGGAAPVPVPNQNAAVRFLDYDGTLLHSYTAEEFAALTELPAAPERPGLTAQGWNWDLADAKAFVAKYGRIDIGQSYITDDGKTRIYIHLTEGRTSPVLGFEASQSAKVTIDWGDDSTDSVSGSGLGALIRKAHNYMAAGDYVITIELEGEGEIAFSGTSNGSYILRYSNQDDNRDRAYLGSIQRVELGRNVHIRNYAFIRCTSLASIVIPEGTNVSTSGHAFMICSSLSSVVLPKGVISVANSVFRESRSLSSVILPKSITSIEAYAFYSTLLSSIAIPEGVTSINSDTFYNTLLSSIVIPEGVTSIEQYAFQYCYNLVSVVISEGVTSINSGAFSYCSALARLTVKAVTPPALSGTLSGPPSDMEIYVPAESVEAYKAATNWSAYADRIFPIPGTEVADTDTTDPN